MQRAVSLEKILMLGKIEGKRRRGRQKMRWLAGIADSMDMNLSKLQATVKDRGVWRAAVKESDKESHNSVAEQQCQSISQKQQKAKLTTPSWTVTCQPGSRLLLALPLASKVTSDK